MEFYQQQTRYGWLFYVKCSKHVMYVCYPCVTLAFCQLDNQLHVLAIFIPRRRLLSIHLHRRWFDPKAALDWWRGEISHLPRSSNTAQRMMYSHSYTLWCRIFVEKLVTAQVVNKFTALWTWRFITILKEAPLLDLILSQSDPVLSPHPVSLTLILILFSHIYRSPKYSLFLKISDQIFFMKVHRKRISS